MKAYAPAKINLGLEIISKRLDGYHNVDMIMQSIDLFDEVTIEETFDGKISVHNEKNKNCPENEDIAYICAEEFFKKIEKTCPGISITIDKKIPISAGLGGGSSDGAAVLVLLNRMYGDILSENDLVKIGGKVGSDIPFCISGGTARAFGIGTRLRKIPAFQNYFLVIVKPSISISTKKAYKLSDIIQNKRIKNFNEMENQLLNSDFEGLSKGLFNRFEELVKSPFILKIRETLSKFGASGSLMSGSGSSVYGLFKNNYIARTCYENLKKRYTDVFLCRPIDSGIKIV